MGLNFDTSFFSIICELNGALYTPECDLADMQASQLIEDLRNGQFENVHAIFEFNPVEGWCNNVTDDVLAAAFSHQGAEESNQNDSTENWSDYKRERIEARLAGVTTRVAA
ncbi:hypothetical protein ABLO27_17865 [Roseibium sp. SCPC15]|jgi:hypothetical protein|uniref:hypothetical protein n=1 Tax=Roseibium sp. SCP15 TaxID=3141376 RepID=UPI0033359753